MILQIIHLRALFLILKPRAPNIILSPGAPLILSLGTPLQNVQVDWQFIMQD